MYKDESQLASKDEGFSIIRTPLFSSLGTFQQKKKLRQIVTHTDAIE